MGGGTALTPSGPRAVPLTCPVGGTVGGEEPTGRIA